MKKLNLLYIIALYSLFIIGIFLIVLIYSKRIKSGIFSLISIYGYIGILIIAFIVDILFQPIGPEIPLIAARTIALNMIIVIFLTIIGSMLASFFNYKIGKILYPKVCGDKRYTKYIKLYQKHGKFSLLVAALGPIPYTPFCWFSGALGLSIKNFLYFGIFPRTLRIIFVSYLISLIF